MAASSIKVPMRTRSSSTVSSTSPTLVSVKSFTQRVTAVGGASKTLPSIASTLSAANSSQHQNHAPIQAQSQTQSIQGHTQGQGQQGQNSTTANKPKPRRPSLPILPASQTQLSQKPSQLQPTKDIQSLRTPRSLPRLNAVTVAAATDRNDSTLAPSLIGRPASALSSPRSYTSTSSSPRLGSSSANRFGDSRPASALSHTNNNNSNSSSTPSLIAKPVSRIQKSATIKPPSIVTKPSSPGISNGTNTSTSMSNASTTSNSTGGSSSSSSGSASARSFALPPIAPSPNTASIQTPFSTTSTTTPASFTGLSPLMGSSSIPTLTSLTAATAAVAAATATASGSSSTSTTVRSKNRLNAGIDSACFMTRSSSGESLASSSASSSPVSTPVITASPTMPSTATVTGIGTTTLLPSAATNSSRKSISRRPSTADLTPASSPSTRNISSVSPSKSAITKPAGTRAASPLSNTNNTNEELTTESTAQPAAVTTVVKCTCPPPLEFPENVKREMRREEEEHRQRECGLYKKIIELQIENANLQGEKDTLHRVLSRRDKMLLELQMQLQAIEFVCRENEIKVDIDMCPDEAIENWSFKESDEVYQRILLTTQDLLRNGSKCLEENMIMPRSSSQHQRPTRTSSFPSSTSSTTRSSFGGTVPVSFALFENGIAPRRNVVAGLSEGAQPLTVQDQDVDPLLFKETSRPGTLKLDLQTLLRSEKDFNSSNSNKARSIVNQGNLAEVDAGIERGGRRAIDCGDDRSSFFRSAIDSNNQVDGAVDGEVDDDDDDTEGEESEFEELGEDMIKFVDLQSSVVPRRDSRASSFSMLVPPGGSHSVATTPDLSSAVLMKNMWSANGSARRSASTTPLHHPAFQQMSQQQYHHQHQQQHYSPSHRNSANRSSGGSALSSSSSLLDDYFTRPQSTSAPQEHQLQQSAPVGLGLGLSGLGRSPEQLSTERFLSAPPRDAPPPPPTSKPLPPFPMSHSRSGSPRAHPLSNSPLGHDNPATFPSAPSSHYQLNHHLNSSNDNNAIRSPPTTPLPPLPSRPRYSYREHTKTKLLQAKVPTHGRTCSHGFAIENVGQFLKRRTYGKTLTRDIMHRGLRRRDSV
ncbi:hypothetical protein BG015_011779 [Linnemannia schmuckeri]|uniref:Uncharacterized protein n=1 Tax=Linnemannia schmuckeri TaxID=64567 RepID=A0A9P5RSJ7_9FUNG|nr:hypothetical protein BG015_011779 [Linnemannia schmuckeri]